MNHPGTILSAKCIQELQARYKAKHPITLRAYAKLLQETPPDFTPTPCQKICVMWDKSIDQGEHIAIKDAPMAYRLALQFLLTQDPSYAAKSIQIITAWMNACTTCTGDNQQLSASWSQTLFARTLELLRYTYKDFPTTLIPRYMAWMNAVMLPAINKPITWTFQAGPIKDLYTNWHASILECKIQYAILINDTTAFKTCIGDFKKMVQVIIKLPYYLANETLYRDHMHGCMSLASLTHVAEIAYHQGVDLYSDLLKNAIEASAKISLGEIPPSLPQPIQKASYWPYAWSIAYNHYVNRKNIPMPNTKRLLDQHPVDYSWLMSSSTALTHSR